MLTTLASGLPLLTITIRVLQVLAFTVILGLAFDVWLLQRHGRFRAGKFVSEVGGVSSTGLFWTGILFHHRVDHRDTRDGRDRAAD